MGIKKEILENYLPFFKACTLTSKEILKIIEERPDENVAILAFKSGRVAPEDVSEIVRLLPDNSYDAYRAAMECNLSPKQQLEVIKATPSSWRYVPGIRAIELGCDQAQILEIFNLIEYHLYDVAPTAIQSGKLDKNSMFVIFERVIKDLLPKLQSLATETAEAMIENDIMNEDDVIRIINRLPVVGYPRRTAVEIVFKRRVVDSAYIFLLLEISGEEKRFVVSDAIKTKKLTSDEIIRAVRNYGQSNWEAIATAIEIGSFSKDQILEIFRLGEKKGLVGYQKEWRNDAIKKARIKGFVLKQTFWRKWTINKA